MHVGWTMRIQISNGSVHTYSSGLKASCKYGYNYKRGASCVIVNVNVNIGLPGAHVQSSIKHMKRILT
jgi:hypothetical protein